MDDLEYFERFMKIRPLIIGNRKIFNSMKHIVKKKLLDESPYFIGKGLSTVVYGLGKLEEFTERELFLAIRIGYNSDAFDNWKEPFGFTESLANGEVGAFEKAFCEYNPNATFYRKRLIPPFFVGAFCWRELNDKKLFGILTEDLTSGGNNKVIEDELSEEGLVVYPDGHTEQYFMDPRNLKNNLGDKYMKKGKIISLGRI